MIESILFFLYLVLGILTGALLRALIDPRVMYVIRELIERMRRE